MERYSALCFFRFVFVSWVSPYCSDQHLLMHQLNSAYSSQYAEAVAQREPQAQIMVARLTIGLSACLKRDHLFICIQLVNNSHNTMAQIGLPKNMRNRPHNIFRWPRMSAPNARAIELNIAFLFFKVETCNCRYCALNQNDIVT